MILLRPLPSAGLNESVQDAESRRYSADVLRVLPLRTGALAVLSPRYEIFAICDTFEEAITLTLAANAFIRLEVKTHQRLPSAPLSLDDVEL